MHSKIIDLVCQLTCLSSPSLIGIKILRLPDITVKKMSLIREKERVHQGLTRLQVAMIRAFLDWMKMVVRLRLYSWTWQALTSLRIMSKTLALRSREIRAFTMYWTRHKRKQVLQKDRQWSTWNLGRCRISTNPSKLWQTSIWTWISTRQLIWISEACRRQSRSRTLNPSAKLSI